MDETNYVAIQMKLFISLCLFCLQVYVYSANKVDQNWNSDNETGAGMAQW